MHRQQLNGTTGTVFFFFYRYSGSKRITRNELVSMRLTHFTPVFHFYVQIESPSLYVQSER